MGGVLRGLAGGVALAAALAVLPAWPAPSAACDSILPPGLLEALGEGRREFLERGLSDYREVNGRIRDAIGRRLGGEWWVVEYAEGGAPRRLRGVAEGGGEIPDPGAAVERADLLKEGLEDVLYCCGTSFGAPAVREDRWSYTVVFRQVVKGVAVEKAGLAFRMLREFDGRLREAGQWNVEISADTVSIPAGFEVRPLLGSPEAARLMGVAAPTLVIRRGTPDGGPPRLCWRGEDAGHVRYVDAASGEMLPAVAKRRLLR